VKTLRSGCEACATAHTAEPGKGRHGGLAILLAALSMAGPFSIDTFFPSFHAIAAQFSISAWAVQQTLTVYMLPLSFMSLVQGPLSDAVGREEGIRNWETEKKKYGDNKDRKVKNRKKR